MDQNAFGDWAPPDQGKERNPAYVTDPADESVLNESRAKTEIAQKLHRWGYGTLDKRNAEGSVEKLCIGCVGRRLVYPGFPVDSMWLAMTTSSDQTSYCHLWSPTTPDKTNPVWTPIRMFTSTPVASRTSLTSHNNSYNNNNNWNALTQFKPPPRIVLFILGCV